MIIGRFAPSPTGPLHLGSLVAAVGSWLSARASGGRWLVRMEDLDAPRVIPGSADAILRALDAYGLVWDGEVVWQSKRTSLYESAIATLREAGLTYDCGCSRSELQQAASAPAGAEAVYPGTCRDGLPDGRRARATRFRAPMQPIEFHDLAFGRVEERVAERTGDFVVKRADGPYAYQLAVVVDDAQQGVTEVVRGADLLASTARQITLQRALGYPPPKYHHLPLVVADDGAKISKRNGALALPALNADRIRTTLALALRVLGIDVEAAPPREMLKEALGRFEPSQTPRDHYVIVTGGETPLQRG